MTDGILEFVDELPPASGRGRKKAFNDEVMAELRKNAGKFAKIKVGAQTAYKFAKDNPDFEVQTRKAEGGKVDVYVRAKKKRGK